MKKALASVALVATLVSTPISAAEKAADSYKPYKTPNSTVENIIENQASFPWMAVGIIGVAVTAGLIAGFACCD